GSCLLIPGFWAIVEVLLQCMRFIYSLPLCSDCVYLPHCVEEGRFFRPLSRPLQLASCPPRTLIWSDKMTSAHVQTCESGVFTRSRPCRGRDARRSTQGPQMRFQKIVQSVDKLGFVIDKSVHDSTSSGSHLHRARPTLCAGEVSSASRR